MLETTIDVNYSIGGMLETTQDANYFTRGKLETTLNANYSTGGMLEILDNLILFYKSKITNQLIFKF